jgi:isochorismate synthase
MNNKSLNEKINSLLDANFRFVLFKKPNDNTIFVYSQINDEKYDSGFVICDFLNTQKHFVYPENIDRFEITDFDSTFPVLFKKIENSFFESKENKTKAEYISMINSAKDKLNNEFKKIVLSRVIHWKNTRFNELNHFITLCKNNPTAFNYLVYIPNTLCWLGASPELLIQYKNQKLSTVSLAGTKKKNESWTSKEWEEQQIVTDYIVAIFAHHKISFSVDKQEVISNYLNFDHLKTTIFAENIALEKAKILLNELHPTPAVCGVPKDKALKIINELEANNRSFYTGYIGLVENNELELFVNLRCASVFKDSVSVFVGGGITTKSNPEKEWEETELKSKVIIN